MLAETLLVLLFLGSPFAESLPKIESPAANAPISSGGTQVKPPKVPEYRVEYVKKKLIKNGLTPAEVEEFFSDPRLYVYKEKPQLSINWKKLEEDIMAPESVERGKQFLEKHKGALKRAYKKYGVAPEYIVAVFRIESNLELFFGNYFATSVFYYKLARGCPKEKPKCWEKHAKQFIALVLYCKQAGEDCHTLKSSHEGAFGIGQFMPVSYLHFAEDGDGNKVIDLFNPDDAIMSTAKFLEKHGWKKSKERALISYYGSRGSRYYRLITLNYAVALQKK